MQIVQPIVLYPAKKNIVSQTPTEGTKYLKFRYKTKKYKEGGCWIVVGATSALPLSKCLMPPIYR